MIKTFTKYQKRVLATCFMLYLCTYVGRHNLPPTLGSLMEAMDANKGQVGTLSTLWAIAYAAGQLFFGNIADRFEPKRLMLAGAIGSAVCNLTFSFMDSLTSLQIVWTLNGVFQSMVWTPIVLCMAYVFEPEKRGNASFVMSFTLALGQLAAWGVAILMDSLFSWRWSFRIPSLVLASGAFAAYFLLPGNLKGEAKRTNTASVSEPAPVKELMGTGLCFLLICCVMNGFVRDSVNNWAPKMLSEMSTKSDFFKLVIPIINLVGIVASRLLLNAILAQKIRLRINIRMLVGLLMGFLFAPSLILALTRSLPLALTALLMGIVSSLLYGTNPMLTTMIPMQFDSFGRVGLVAGLIDCFIYLGSSLSGTVTGMISDAANSWDLVYLLWAGAMLLGCAMAVLASLSRKQRPDS